jgi:mannose-1-phosphate guanylyltransferase/mannose-1-phosphate guanylyltransferase/phosphomannomutase
MKAMVLAAGLGTRLRPLTFEIPKPMVPLFDRPLMAHIVELCRRQGFDELVANLHYFPDSIRDYFGGALRYSYEQELLGTAGGVRNARDFFADELVVVVSGDSLTDIDLNNLVERHKSAGGIATLAVKQVDDPRELGVVLHDSDGRVSGFQEKPHPDEALSSLANCGIYCFSPEVFDYFPGSEFVDWASDVFPVLLENDVPFYIHEIDEYWNDAGSFEKLRAGTFDALEGRLRVDVPGEEVAPGVRVEGGAALPADCEAQGPVWIGGDCRIGSGVRLMGPVVIGDGSRIGDGAALRDAIVFPCTTVPDQQIVVGATYGHAGIVASLRPFA